MWEDEGIPIFDKKYVIKKIRAEYGAVRKSSKMDKGVRQTPGAVARKFESLFDIARCKCKTQDSCNCQRYDRIAPEEWSFLQDQRGPRKLTLGNVDRTTNSLLNARLQRRNIRLQQETLTR